ncbi:MAG: hypothetical protein Q8K17_03825 [Pseudohongiella sp.]|nr:hypothetical protein [Pseudohongiella sp.]MDP2092109.1 hypothetical protein [Pseudohongiella sp.]
MISDAQYLAWLRSPEPKVLLAEMDYYDPVTETIGTMYISDRGYNTNWSAGVEHRPYPDYLKTVPTARRTLGDGRPTRGELIVDNTAGERDDWLMRFKWDGRKVRLLYGSASWEYSDFRTVFLGVVKTRSARGISELVFKLREPEDYLDRPLQSVTVATGPSTGDYLPVCYGDCFNVTPVLIDGATHVYQVSDIEIDDVVLVKDNGKGPVSHTADLAAGTITLAGAPVGAITCDVIGAKVSAVVLEKAGEIIDHIITTRTDLPSEFYDSAAFTALDAAITWSHNLYVSGAMTARQAIERILSSIGAKLSRTEAGAITVVRLADPSETAAVAIGPDDFREDSLIASATELPWLNARLGYRRNWTVQESLDTVLTVDERAALTREFAIVTGSNDLAGVHPLGNQPDLIETTLTYQADAQDRLDELLALYAVERFVFELHVYAVLYQFPVGSTVKLTADRYGFNAGVNCVVHDTDSVFTSGRARLGLWR